MRNIVRAAAAAAGLVVTTTAAAGAGVWSTTGPYGGEVNAIAVRTAPAHTLYAATRGGVFRSTDQGATWVRDEVGLLPGGFAPGLAPERGGDVLYLRAAGAGIYRRDDALGVWLPRPLPVAGLPDALAVSPIDGDTLVAARGSEVYRSADGGTSWLPSESGLPPASAEVTIGFLHHAGSRVYAAQPSRGPATGDTLLYVSDDGGQTFAAAAGPDTTLLPAFEQVLGLVGQAGVADQIFLFGRGRLLSSASAGSSWNAIAPPVGCAGITDLDTDAADPLRLVLTCINGVYVSTSFGSDWAPLGTGLAINGAGTVIGLRALVEDPPGAGGATWVGSPVGGVQRFVPGPAATWARVNAGLEARTFRAVVFHPVDSTRWFAGASEPADTGDGSEPLFASSDDGATWTRSDAGLASWAIRAIAVDRASATTPASTRLFAVGRRLFSPARANSGVYRSDDGGASWTALSGGFPLRTQGGVPAPFIGTVRGVALDPRSCLAPVAGDDPCPPGSGPLQTVYVGGSGAAPSGGAPPYPGAGLVWKSVDGGSTWAEASSGLPPPVTSLPGGGFYTQLVIPLAIDPRDGKVVYVGTAINFALDAPAPSGPNGVFKSVDGGATWTLSSTGLPRHGDAASAHQDVFAIAIAPGNPDRLYAAVQKQLIAPDFTSGVYRSDDAGATWSFAGSGIGPYDIRALVVDPSDPTGATVYAGVAGNGAASPGAVWKSTDAGATWNAISLGLPADAALGLSIDPADPARLIASTTSGVYELTQVPDPDVDGVSLNEETNGPDGVGADADGDGVTDAEDPDTATFQLAADPDLVLALAKAGTRTGTITPYATMTAKPAEGTGTCAGQLNNVTGVPSSALPPVANGVGFKGQWGQVRFEAPRCEAMVMEITYHGAAFTNGGWRWRNFGPTVPGDDSRFEGYFEPTAEQVGPDTWRVRIAAGQRGSWRDLPDAILFQGGPVVDTDIGLINGFE